MKYFKQLDNTKKIVILFIIISFVFIGFLGIYHSFYQNEDNAMNQQDDNIKEESQEVIEQDITENKQAEDRKENKKPKQKISNQTKKEQTKKPQSKKITSQNKTNKTETQKSQSNTNKDNTKVEENHISVSMKIVGMGETMMEGSINIKKGTSVYDALVQFVKSQGKKVSGSSSYVTGIAGLNEKDHGFYSGWMYSVNGKNPNVGAGSYQLNDGDLVKWSYVNYQ